MTQVPEPVRAAPLPGCCSVVCTTYNHAAFSGAALQSIFDQSYRNIEIVIVDDGSKDGNVAAMREKLAGSPFPFVLIDQENTGKIGLNVNRGLAAARGEFVSLFSLDDLLLPDCIETKIARLTAEPTLAFVANASCLEIDEREIIGTVPVKASIHGKGYRTAAELLEHEFSHFGTFLLQAAVLRRSLVDAVGGYEEEMTGDDLILRTKVWQYLVTRPDLGFAFQDEPGFIYRKHGSNLHRDTFRQLRTLIEWRDRFFPGRPMPERFTNRALSFFDRCLAERRKEALEEALRYSPELATRYADYRASWRFRRRALERFLKRQLGQLPK